MTEIQLQALLSYIDAKITLSIAQSKGHIKQVDPSLYKDTEDAFQILWNTTVTPPASAEAGYTAADIEVLKGLEPARRRPDGYIV